MSEPSAMAGSKAPALRLLEDGTVSVAGKTCADVADLADALGGLPAEPDVARAILHLIAPGEYQFIEEGKQLAGEAGVIRTLDHGAFSVKEVSPPALRDGALVFHAFQLGSLIPYRVRVPLGERGRRVVFELLEFVP